MSVASDRLRVVGPTEPATKRGRSSDEYFDAAARAISAPARAIS